MTGTLALDLDFGPAFPDHWIVKRRMPGAKSGPKYRMSRERAVVAREDNEQRVAAAQVTQADRVPVQVPERDVRQGSPQLGPLRLHRHGVSLTFAQAAPS